MKQKGFIQIPLLIAIIVAIVFVSTVTVGVVLYKQGKLNNLIASVSQIFEGNKQAQQVSQEEVLRNEQELEKARLEAEKAKSEAEKAQAQAETATANAEVERLKKEAEETKKLATTTKQSQPSEQPQQQPQQPTKPTITGISPDEILSNVDISIAIYGTNFRSGGNLIIGTITLTKDLGSVNVVNDKLITFTYPRGSLSPGTYNIIVKNKDGSEATSASLFKIIDASQIAQTPSSPQELTPEEIIAKTSPAVVQILNDVKQGVGSGMIIDQTGYILTNEHVIRGDSAVEVNYNGQIFSGVPVIGWNAIKDLAIVKLTGNNFSYINLGDSNSIILGQDVIALGYPLSNFPSSITTLEGIISNRSVTNDLGTTFFQTSANVQHGSSGGPLVDKKGNSIGVNSWCPDIDIVSNLCPVGYALAIKINEAKSILSDLKSGAKVSVPTPTPSPTPSPTPQPTPPPSDTTPPEISNIQVTSIGTNSATITWNTSEPSTSQVQYGTTSSLGNSTPLNSNLVSLHSITLNSLSAGINYYYKVISKDVYNNQAESLIQQFSTQNIPVGTLQIIPSGDRPAAAQFVAGTTGNSMMEYKFYANNEDIEITSFYVATREAHSGANIANVKLYLDGVALGDPAGYTLDASDNGKVLITLNPRTFIVPKSFYKILTIRVNLADKSSLTDADAVEIGLGDADGDYTDWGVNGAPVAGRYYVTATGIYSGATIANDGTTGWINSTAATGGTIAASFTQYLYDGVLVASLASGSPSGTQTAGAGKEVMRLDLAAVGDDITINEMEFCVAGTASGVTGTGNLTIKSSDLGTTYATIAQSDFDNYWDNILGAGDYYPMKPSVSGGSCFSVGDDPGLSAHNNIVAFSTPLKITAGTNKTIRVFGDTTGAASTQALQLALQANGASGYATTVSGLSWEDSSWNAVDSTLTKNLPVTGGSLIY